MKVIVADTFTGACDIVAGMIADLIKAKPMAKLGLATGSSPVDVYDRLVEMCVKGLDFSGVSTVNLDEYKGINGDNPASYNYYMNKILFNRINIDQKNTYVPSGINDTEQELRLFKRKIYEGQIDLQLLGVGVNGHIGFNEPADALYGTVHVEKLSKSTISINSRFFPNEAEVPVEALTMGIGDIMSAARVVLLAGGSAKVEAIKSLIMNGFVTPQVPVTFIKMHPAATVVIDRELADATGVLQVRDSMFEVRME
jgi:glucosamine-6-phosphate deaminase